MKRKSTISLIFLFISLIISGGAIGFLFLKKGLETINDISFYVLCGIAVTLIIGIIVALGNQKNYQYIQTLENRLDLWNTLSYKLKGAGETAFNDLPIGVIVLDSEYQVKWSNPIVQKMLMSNLKEKNLKSIANGKLYEYIIYFIKFIEFNFIEILELFI